MPEPTRPTQPAPPARPTVLAAWSPDLLRYDFGRGHPMSPVRLDLTMRLARALGVLDGDRVVLTDPEPADDALLTTAHSPAYVAAVRHASLTGEPDLAHGLGTDDDPVFTGMHEAAARIVRGTAELASAVWSGAATHGVNIAGGMHHAMRDHASGFCLYNDVVVAIRRLLDEGARRVAYVDLDAHHGDGVEAAFWDDPRVLTISVHESGHSLFPGTGQVTDAGGPAARGTVVNVPLPAGTRGPRWLRAVEAVVPPLVRAFAPDVVVSQHGCDAHQLDPLTNLAVSVEAQRAATVLVHDLAHEVADGRWLALGGGGYALVQVVPRAWAHVLAVAAHRPVDPATPVPGAWLDHVARTLGVDGPAAMGDDADRVLRLRPWGDGYDPADDVDRVVLAVRTVAFPEHDLDPLYD